MAIAAGLVQRVRSRPCCPYSNPDEADRSTGFNDRVQRSHKPAIMKVPIPHVFRAPGITLREYRFRRVVDRGSTVAGHLEKGAAVRLRHCCLSLGLVLTFVPVGVLSASPASADCTSAGYATVCAQGDVRGGGPTPTSGVVYPSYCADPWYCDDGWDLDVDLGPIRPPINIGGPGRPGGGGGIGPRR